MVHGLGPTRQRVLHLLQCSGKALSVSEVAENLEMHRNSARFHLDALTRQGFATRTVAVTGQQGRPPLLYVATNDSPSISTGHITELVAMMIKNFVAASDNSPELAHTVGLRWGTATAAEEPVEDPKNAVRELESYFCQRGFAASATDDSISMGRCPFRTIIDDDELPLMCAIHRGFVDGYLITHGCQKQVRDLQLFHDRCSMTLEPTTSGPRRQCPTACRQGVAGSPQSPQRVSRRI